MLEEYLNDQNVVTKLLLDSIESEKTVQAYLFVYHWRLSLDSGGKQP